MTKRRVKFSVVACDVCGKGFVIKQNDILPACGTAIHFDTIGQAKQYINMIAVPSYPTGVACLID